MTQGLTLFDLNAVSALRYIRVAKRFLMESTLEGRRPNWLHSYGKRGETWSENFP